MQGTPHEITSLVGQKVYSNNGVFVGEVDDIRLDIHRTVVTGLALGELNEELFSDTSLEDARGVMIPYRWVVAVGDVVLINEAIERVQRDDETDGLLV